jgi:hypothetical protein
VPRRAGRTEASSAAIIRSVSSFHRLACAQAYYLPTSVAVTGLVKTVVCFGASLSLFVALIAHKVAPQPLPPPVPAVSEGEGAGE